MTTGRVYVSTGGDRRRPAVECAGEIVDRSSHRVELSGGRPLMDPEAEVATLAGRRELLLHNYFPPPEEPFVLNLAEPDADTAESSMRLVRRALAISGACGARHFAVHAGFLARPDVRELGQRIGAREVMDRDEGISLMVDRLLQLAVDADAAGVRLLVENHVLSHANLESFGENFLLMVDPDEILAVHRELGGRVGLLLDVGHLHVSTTSLGLSARDALAALDPIAEGYHLSSNSGQSDQHGALSSDDWFWDGMSRDKAFYTVEIHSPSIDEWIDSADMTQRWLDADRGTAS